MNNDAHDYQFHTSDISADGAKPAPPPTMVELPQTLCLAVEGRTSQQDEQGTWTFRPPSDWILLRVEGSCLAFFDLPNGRKVAVNAFLFNAQAWIHASVSCASELPTYDDLCALKAGVFGPDGYAAQVFVPAAEHVNIHPNCLHLWGPMQKKHWPLPVFREGTI